MAAALCKAKGTSILTENVWDNRFQYISELVKFGCDIYVEGRSATIRGIDKLKGCDVLATDLRAGAAMVIAALAAEGETKIGNTRFIDRGYEKIEEKLSALGAGISRIFEE
jgi:UDP-N-acetylglucosamine 1-carboxyvinyltransferase